jgi:hypothetical protein
MSLKSILKQIIRNSLYNSTCGFYYSFFLGMESKFKLFRIDGMAWSRDCIGGSYYA